MVSLTNATSYFCTPCPHSLDAALVYTALPAPLEPSLKMNHRRILTLARFTLLEAWRKKQYAAVHVQAAELLRSPLRGTTQAAEIG